MRLSKTRNAGKNAALETLESRRLYAVTLTSGGKKELLITGTSGADNIVITRSGDNLKIVLDSTHTVLQTSKAIVAITVNLGAGNDKLTADNSVKQQLKVDGNFGKDTITTGGGDDFIFSGNEDDKVYGGDGKDTIQGGSGNDTIDGQGGEDSLEAGPGADKVYGGGGNDKLDAIGTGADVYDGGDGKDRIYYWTRTAGVCVSTDGVANDGKRIGNGTSTSEFDNVLPSVEDVFGSKYSDYISCTGNIDNTIDGLEGNDFIQAGQGKDTVYGFLGDDIIHGNAGSDRIFGENGKDTIFGESGNDTLDGGSDDDELHGDENQDVLNGNAGNDLLFGGSDNDILTGGNGYDKMYGEAGNDIIYTNDLIYNEIVDGGTHFDIAYIDKFPFPLNTPGDLLSSIEQPYLV